MSGRFNHRYFYSCLLLLGALMFSLPLLAGYLIHKQVLALVAINGRLPGLQLQLHDYHQHWLQSEFRLDAQLADSSMLPVQVFVQHGFEWATGELACFQAVTEEQASSTLLVSGCREWRGTWNLHLVSEQFSLAGLNWQLLLQGLDGHVIVPAGDGWDVHAALTNLDLWLPEQSVNLQGVQLWSEHDWQAQGSDFVDIWGDTALRLTRASWQQADGLTQLEQVSLALGIRQAAGHATAGVSGAIEALELDHSDYQHLQLDALWTPARWPQAFGTASRDPGWWYRYLAGSELQLQRFAFQQGADSGLNLLGRLRLPVAAQRPQNFTELNNLLSLRIQMEASQPLIETWFQRQLRGGLSRHLFKAIHALDSGSRDALLGISARLQLQLLAAQGYLALQDGVYSAEFDYQRAQLQMNGRSLTRLMFVR